MHVLRSFTGVCSLCRWRKFARVAAVSRKLAQQRNQRNKRAFLAALARLRVMGSLAKRAIERRHRARVRACLLALHRHGTVWRQARLRGRLVVRDCVAVLGVDVMCKGRGSPCVRAYTHSCRDVCSRRGLERRLSCAMMSYRESHISA